MFKGAKKGSKINGNLMNRSRRLRANQMEVQCQINKFFRKISMSNDKIYEKFDNRQVA
jgi:hypothetical protein